MHKNARLADAHDGRFPTVIFSHGLGGSRNAYSLVAGSLASHGAVVVCPEHRDGSSVVSFVRIPSEQDRYFIKNTRAAIPFRRVGHEASPEVYAARDEQLRIRAWELGLVHAAVLKIDLGEEYKNLNKSTPSLDMFKNTLRVHEPGSIIFGGHSFGSSTTVQFLKSCYYSGSHELDAVEKPLYVPDVDSAVCKQITEQTVSILLDPWIFPLLSPNTTALFNLPLPAWADKPTSPGGTAILSVLSDAFFKWKDHLHATARVLSPDPSVKIIKPEHYQRPNGVRLPEPNFYYVENAAHLSQSDFGILFPKLTKRIFGAVEPERALRLNLRAQLQALRINKFPMARTWAGDLVDGGHVGKTDVSTSSTESVENQGLEDGLEDDKAIFDRSGSVGFWKWIDTIGMGTVPEESGDGEKRGTKEGVEDTEKSMEGELEPGAAVKDATAPSNAVAAA